MGQIIIDLPNRINRRFRLEDLNLAKVIVETLEKEAISLKGNPVTLTDDDKADIAAANRARKGDLADWQDAKAYLRTLE